jgi:hypothetical protein
LFRLVDANHLSQTNPTHFLNETYPPKKKKKLKAIVAVLMEQNRRYKEAGHFAPVDEESMSTCYQWVSITSRKEADERGLKYFAPRSEESHNDSVTDVMEPSHSSVNFMFSPIPVSPVSLGSSISSLSTMVADSISPPNLLMRNRSK